PAGGGHVSAGVVGRERDGPIGPLIDNAAHAGGDRYLEGLRRAPCLASVDPEDERAGEGQRARQIEVLRQRRGHAAGTALVERLNGSGGRVEYAHHRIEDALVTPVDPLPIE